MSSYTATHTPHTAKTVAGQCPVDHRSIDLFEPGSQEYWFEAYKVLHEQCPVVHLPGQGRIPGSDAYIITRYEDIQRLVRDQSLVMGRAEQQTAQGNGNSPIQAEIFADEGFGDAFTAQQHLRSDADKAMRYRRQITDPWVGPEGAMRQRPMIEAAAHRLIDNWIDAGKVEFVRGFAAPLPQTVITTILGLPLQDMPMLRTWEEAQVRRFVYGFGVRNEMSAEDEAENARTLVEFNRYLGEQIQQKRRHPGDDMLSFLTEVEFDGEKMTDADITSVALLMHIGGNETTQYALTAEAMLLAQNPELVKELRDDRRKVRFFVEEALRLYAPTQGLTARTAAKDIELSGTKIPAGSLLHLRFGAANRDHAMYPDAEALNLERHNPGRHMTFSQGPRACPGAGLSRMEQNVATHALLDRIETLELDMEANDFMHQPGIMLGLYHLDLNFTKRT
jgi:cytochrome P450